MSLKYSKILLSSLSVLSVITLLVAVYSNLTAVSEKMNIFFCSDTLYLPSIYRDLVTDGNDIRGWHFNPAPNYFPDMLLYFFLMFITNNFIVSSFVFSFIQFIFLGYLLLKIFKILFPHASVYYGMVIYAFLAFILLEFFFVSKDLFFPFYLMINSYHSGAFIAMLVCTLFSFRYVAQRETKWLVWIFVIGFLAIISDRLFVVFYSIPICVACCLMFKKIGAKIALCLIVTGVFLSFAGLKVADLINTDVNYLLSDTGRVGDWKAITEQLAIFFGLMKQYYTSLGVRGVVAYLFAASILLMIYVFYDSLKKSQNPLIPFYAIFSLAFSVCVLFMPIVAGKFVGTDCIRYNIYPFYMCVLSLIVFTFYKFNRSVILKRSRFVVVTANIALICIGFSKLSLSGLNGYFNYYPDIVRHTDEMAGKEKLKFGVANFWEAKKITMFSKRGLKVCSVFDDIAIYNHAANDNVYFKNKFNFVVLNRFGDTSIYRSKLKDIKVLSNTPEFKMIATRPFYYDKHITIAAINTEVKEQ